MSLVRNCKLLLLSILLLSVAGCKKGVNEPQTIHGNQPRPSWVVTDESNLQSSVTATIKVTTLNGQAIDDTMVGADDLLAAFIGEECVGIMGNECCGVATYIDGLYHLYISPATEAGGEVQLRFYSPDLKRIFEATETIPYSNDTNKGTIADPYTPEWTVAK